jgi:hypothetical protein
MRGTWRHKRPSVTHHAAKISGAAGEARSARANANAYDVLTADITNSTIAAARSMGGVAMS